MSDLKNWTDKQACDESSRNEFDLSKQVRLVPPFNEAEIDMYFQHFEKVADSLKWPKAMWPMLLQTVFKGKAQEAYAALPVIDCSDYNKVKSDILKVYELVPEAYSQRFRAYRKDDKQTYVEFAKQKEVFFDRWCTSKEIGSDYDRLRQLVLIEEFKRCIYDDLKTYLDEKKVDTVHEMATLANDYALTHKRSNKSEHYRPHKSGGWFWPKIWSKFWSKL